jgi:hypothetical protein
MIASGVERAHPRLRDDDIRARVGRHTHGQTGHAGKLPNESRFSSYLPSPRRCPRPTPPATIGIVTAGRYGRALASVHRCPKGTRWRVSPDSRVERLAPLHRTAGTVAGSATVLTFPELLQRRARRPPSSPDVSRAHAGGACAMRPHPIMTAPRRIGRRPSPARRRRAPARRLLCQSAAGRRPRACLPPAATRCDSAADRANQPALGARPA